VNARLDFEFGHAQGDCCAKQWRPLKKELDQKEFAVTRGRDGRVTFDREVVRKEAKAVERERSQGRAKSRGMGE